MAINLNREGVQLNGEERNKRNQNWTIIEENINTAAADYDEALKYVSEKAYADVLDASKLDWQEPVVAFSNLATTYPLAEEGYTAQTTSDGSVYRFDGSGWKKIQQIDAGPVNEVDTRLTALLADKASQQELEIERARISNLTAQAGNTDGNAELLDIRVAFDGTIYPTAGEATRSIGQYFTDENAPWEVD